MTTSPLGIRLGVSMAFFALLGACDGTPSQGGHAGSTGMGSAGETGAAGTSPGAGGGAAGSTSPGIAGST
ncbi:MAG: hypothetical protein JWM82_1529, partial [Myxococcales bacterium]|nr:hypothetical protein [Myxococcales bacterium]